MDASVDGPLPDAMIDGASDVPRIDGGPPAEVTDRDGDGVDDVDDAFPDDPAEWLDSDGDGIGNWADEDEDGDGVADVDDAFPFDPDRSDWPTVTFTESGGFGPELNELSTLPFRVTSTLDGHRDRDGFRFPANEGDIITVLLRTDARAVLDVLEVDETQATPVSTLPHEVGSGVGAHAVVSFRADADRMFDVIVESRSTEGDYTLVVFVDGDLDGVSDDVELALGMRPGSSDPDGDGVRDGSELLLTQDVDADGLPNWYDRDTDGDSILDAIETDADGDADGVADFADTDADDDGTLDGDAYDPTEGAPLDTDLDGLPDFRDADDDDDGIPDVDDAAPLEPTQESDVLADATRVLVVSAEGDLPGAPATEGVVLAGQTLTIRGEGFAASGNIAMLRRADGTSERVAATRVSAELLEATFTEAAEGELTVVSTVTSNTVPLAVVDPRAPLLLPTTNRFTASSGVSIPGLRMLGVTHVELGEHRIDFNAPVTDDQLSFFAGEWMQSETLRAYAGDLVSNPIPMRFARSSFFAIEPPAGASFTTFELELSADSGNPGTAFSGVPVVNGEAEVVTAMLADAGDGAPVMVMQWVYFDGDTSGRPMNALSTAVAQTMILNQALDRVALDSMPDLLAALETLPAITALAARIETGLAADSAFFRDPGAAYASDLASALAAAETVIRDGLADTTLLPISQTANITPEQFDIKVTQRAGTGHVDVENDTAFLLSAEVRDRADRPLQRHIDGPFDTNIIGAQRGALLLFDASTVSLNAPGYRSATVEIVTPGVFAPQPTGTRARYAQDLVRLRTMLDRLLLPVLADLVGYSRRLESKAFRRALITLLLQQSVDTITEFRTAMNSGNAKEGARILFNLFLRDFDSAGPITQLFARALALGGGAALVSSIAARLGAKAVPVLGQIDLLLSAAGSVSTAINLGKVLGDLTDTPGLLEFDVDFGFDLAAVRPAMAAKAHRETVFRVIGAGLASDDGPTEVTFVDEGGGFESFTVTAALVETDGTGLLTAIPAASMARAIGPIRIDVRAGSESGTVPMRVTVDNSVQIDTLDPRSGGPGQAVWIRGRGFASDRRLLAVHFTESETLGLEPRVFETVVLSASETDLLVLVPPGVDSDTGWDVTVEVGRPGMAVRSDPSLFNVTFPPLLGTWDVRYEHFSCRIFTCDQCRWEVYNLRYEMTTMLDAISADGRGFAVSPVRFIPPGGDICDTHYVLFTNPADPDYGRASLHNFDGGCTAPLNTYFEGRFSAIGDVFRGMAVRDRSCMAGVVPGRITAVRRL